jgi:hypothetical protein
MRFLLKSLLALLTVVAYFAVVAFVPAYQKAKAKCEWSHSCGVYQYQVCEQCSSISVIWKYPLYF